MAFHAPQESTNRKLLEQLAEQKKRLQGGLRGGHISQAAAPTVPPAPSTSSSAAGSGSSHDECFNFAQSSLSMTRLLPIPSSPGPLPVASSVSTSPSDAAGMTSQQRTALQYAHANSVGYFVSQDSSFGNLILPVLPRYADKITAT